MSVAAVTAIASKTLDKNMRGPTKKKQRLSYSVMFKLAAVCYAETYGNRATARYVGVNEKQIRDWKAKKHHLILCDSQAKRLKGAGRYRTQNTIVETNYGKKINSSSDLTGQPLSSFAGTEEENKNLWPYFFDTSKTLHNSAHERRFQKQTFKDSAERRKEIDQELDFHERFSCALALLDLKKGA